MEALKQHLPEPLCAAESWCCHTVFSNSADNRQKFSLGIFMAHFRHFRVDMGHEVFGGISLKAARYFTVFWVPPGLRLKLLF